MPAGLEDIGRSGSISAVRSQSGEFEVATGGHKRAYAAPAGSKHQCGPVSLGATIKRAAVETRRYCDEPSDMPAGIADAFEVCEVANGALLRTVLAVLVATCG